MERENAVKMQMGQPVFPREIVEELLSRLPVVSLLKFRCVSKSWRSLIDSENFIKFHLKKSTQNPCFSHHRIILNPLVSSNWLLKTCCWASLLKQAIVNPFEFYDVKHIPREVNIVGCCNGLVCLVNFMGEFILWNPATRMSINLPDVDVDDGGNFSMYGFGYDESSHDYKVFVIISYKQSTIGRIYSFKSHSWKTFEDNDSPCVGDDIAGMFVSGNLHWFADELEDEDEDEDEDDDGDDKVYELVIVSFDLKNEVFGVVELPSNLEGYIPIQTLGVMEGCFSVLCDYRNSHFDVWVMKEYGLKESWVNLYTISNVNHPPLRKQEVSSFCRGPNGEVLLIYGSAMVIYYYYPEDNAFRGSRIVDMDRVAGEGVYVESLVSLGPYAEAESV